MMRRRLGWVLGVLLGVACGAMDLRAETHSVVEAAEPHTGEEYVVRISFERDGQRGRALGVMVQLEGKPFLVTSQSALLGAERLHFETLAGEALAPRSVELARRRNLVRLSVPDYKGGVELAAEKLKPEAPIVFLTDSKAASDRAQEGMILGVGGLKFEISCAFDEEAVGGPILDEKGLLIGLASHELNSSKHAMKKGTRFEEATRYFGFRLKGTSWEKVNWKQYNRLYGATYWENKALEERILALFKAKDGLRIGGQEARKLSSTCRMRGRKLEKLIEHRGMMTPYLYTELDQQLGLFEFCEAYFKKYADARGQ